MSSFIVQDNTINGILTYASVKALGSRPQSYPARAFFRDPAVTVNAENPTDKELAALGLSMFGLNIIACEARYGEGRSLPCGDNRTFKYARTYMPTPMQAYKSLNCLLYQMSEGDVPNHPLYKALEAFQVGIGHAILCETSEYEKAAWDA